jgi:N-acetylneuraminic acid mutarotase/alpha-tubulin suppressor-like RCC1 family protein
MGDRTTEKEGRTKILVIARNGIKRAFSLAQSSAKRVRAVTKGLHDKTYNKVGWYRKWSDSKTSETVHKALSIWLSIVVFVVLSIIVLFVAPLSTGLQAANRSVTWTTKTDFDYGTTSDCAPVEPTNPAEDALLAMAKGRTEYSTWLGDTSIPDMTPRYEHTAVWTGTKMIVWGGGDSNGPTNTGGIYDPDTDAWTQTSTLDTPSARSSHTAIWTGTKMIVWGGSVIGGLINTGGIYDPGTDAWTQTSTLDAPSARGGHTAIWTGTKMIIWGGYNDIGGTNNTGGIYDPETDAWTQTSTLDVPSARYNHTAIWMGTKMIVWGGYDINAPINTGGIYDPETDAWTQTSTLDAPSVRHQHTAIWTGTKMIVWGGYNDIGGTNNTGGIYDPGTDAWTQTSTLDAPSARGGHTAIWTGTKMVIWGGWDYANYQSKGGIYDMGTDTWKQTSTVNAPSGRGSHTAIWTGTKMIVWGGSDNSGYFNTGKIAEFGDIIYPDLYKQICSVSGFKTNASNKVSWTNLEWNAVNPLYNSFIYFKTRSAATEAGLATATWSDYTSMSGDYYGSMDITSPRNIWLEIDLMMESNDGATTPAITDFTVFYTELNAPEDLADQSDLAQYTGSGAGISGGGFIGPGVTVQLSDSDVSCLVDGLYYYYCRTQFEIKRIDESFSGNEILEGSDVAHWYGSRNSTIVKNFTPEGAYSYKWRARVIDDSGMTSSWTEFNGGNAAFTVDVTPPEGRVFFENGATKTKASTVHLGVEATDAGAGVSAVRFSNDGAEWSGWENYQTIKDNGKLWYLLPGDGAKTVYAQFKDKAGNVSGKTWQTKSDFKDNGGTTNEITKTNILVEGGDNDADFGTPMLTAGNEQFKSVWQSGYDSGSTYAIDAESNLWVTGSNQNNRFGRGDTNNVFWTKTPVSGVKKIGSSYNYTLVLNNSNELWGAGYLFVNQLQGYTGGTYYNDYWYPILTDVADVWSGGDFAYVKKLDGSYWVAGDNGSGQLGLGADTPWAWDWVPAPADFSNLKELGVSKNAAYMIKNNGELWFIGNQGRHGSFGIGVDNDYNYSWILSRDDVAMVGRTSDDHSTIIKTLDGKYYGCGSSGNGDPPNGLGFDTLSWGEITNMGDVKQFIPGHNHFIIQKTNNEYWGSGRNNTGALGLGSTRNIDSWTRLTIPLTAKQVIAGYDATFYLDANNGMWVAGRNSLLGVDNGGYDITEFTMPPNLKQYLSPGTMGGTDSAIGLRYDAGSVIKWTGITPDWSIAEGQAIKFAVKTSDDGVSWSELLGRDGNAINWDTNYFGEVQGTGISYLSSSAITPSRYFDITARLESSNIASTPFIKSLTLNIPISASIEVDSIPTEIYFDQNNKYPNPNWNVKENVNSVEFRFTTNKNAAVYVDFGSDNATREAGGDPVLDMNHSMKIKALNSSTTYKYRIRAVDDFDNIALKPDDSETNLGSFYTFTTGGANEGFEGIPAVSEMEQVEITASTAKITWKTKIPTSSWVDYGLGIELDSTDGSDNLTTTHVVELKNLIAGSTYNYRVRGLDAGDNEFLSSVYTFRAVMQPQILEVKAENVTATSVEVSWSTNVKTDSDVAYGIGNYAERVKDVGLLTAHRVTLKDLNDDTLYQYQIEARDDYGNITKSQALSFKTTLDTAGPTIEDVRIDVVPVESDQTTAQIIMSWKTNKPATTKIEYGEGVVGGTYDKSSIEDPSLNINHTVIIKELNPATSYHFRIISKDKRDNMTKSSDYTIVTPAKQKSIWQLILSSLQNTFSWVSDMPKFWGNVGEKIR